MVHAIVADSRRLRVFEAASERMRELLEGRASNAIILFASPRLLPMLKRSLPASLLRLVRREVLLDLAHQPSGALRKRIEPALRTLEKQLARPELAYHAHRMRRHGGARAPVR